MTVTEWPAFANDFITECPIIQCDLHCVGNTPNILYPFVSAQIPAQNKMKIALVNFIVSISVNY